MGGGQSSRKTGEVAMNPNLPYTAELSSYEAACRLDPDLQSFDTTLQVRTKRVINSLATGVEVRSLSFDSMKEVTGCLLEMNQEVVRIILECKKDIWKNQHLFELVEDYFENSLQTLDFCTALEKCLNRARDGQLILQVALQQFEQEEEEEEEGGEEEEDFDKEEKVGDGERKKTRKMKKKYSRTLEELRNFKAAGEPFTEEFFQIFQSVYRQQVLMLEKLQMRKSKIDKKLRHVKVWRKVSSIIFASAFAAILICSVVAAAMAAPPVAAALAAATSIPIGSMGKWFDSLWKDYEVAMKGQKEVLNSMQAGTYVAIMDLDTIRVLVDQLELQLDGMAHNAEFAMRDDGGAETAMKLGIEEIKKKLGALMKSIEDLGEQADKCSRDIRRARTVVLQRIIKHPN